MSDFRAIAAMTATLRNMLQDGLRAVEQIIGGATVHTRPPSQQKPEPQPAINIFLYQVSQNSNWRNMDLPTHNSEGSLIRRPIAALDLHYLFTFYGDNDRLIPQLLMGLTAEIMHAWPYPLPRYIPHRLNGGQASVGDGGDNQLYNSGLLEQLELLRITPLPMNVEELSKLWTVFFQQPYALSAAYLCSVILIEADLQPQAPALPAARPSPTHDPSFQLPEIDQVSPQNVLGGTTGVLTIRGTNLYSQNAVVEIGGQPAAILSASTTTLVASLPEGLAAGKQSVRVARHIEMGQPPKQHRLFESNPASFVVRPTIDPLSLVYEQPPVRSHRGLVRLRVRPSVAPRQKVWLLLNGLQPADHGQPCSYTLPAMSPVSSDELSFSARDLAAGDYLVRVKVDDVTSPLATDDDPSSPTFGRYVAPALNVPSRLDPQTRKKRA